MGARRTRRRHAHKRKTRRVKRGGHSPSRKRARTPSPPRRQRTPSPRTPSPIWKRVLRTLKLRR